MFALTFALAAAFPYPLQETTLDNGARVVVVPMPGRGMFAMYEVVGTGSRDEVEAGHSGFAHFFEHMMFRGTKKFPSDARTALLGSLGVNESGYTTDDFTTYHLQGPKEALAKIVELEGDRFQNLEYSEEAFKTESRAVLGEYNKNASSPDFKANEVLSDLAFDKHTYKHTTMGFLADIQKMPERFDYSRKFFQRFYTPDNVLFIVVGDVDNAQVVDLFKKHFSSWKGKRQKTDVKDEPALTKERRKAIRWENPTLERLHVGWRVPSSARDIKAGALSMVLKGYVFSDSSDLTKKVVLDEQLAENVSSWYDAHRDAAVFPVVARIKPGKSADTVLERIQSALDDVAAGKIDKKRFEAVKSNLKYSILMGLTSPDSVAGTLAWTSGPFMDVHALDKQLDAVDASTVEDFVSFTKTHFAKDKRAIVTVAHAPAKGGAK
jgi:zinc protease